MASAEHKHVSIVIGTRIRGYRKAQKMSQDQLAFECQLTRNTIVNIERGVGNPRLNTMLTICKVLQIEINDLFKNQDSD